VCRVTKCGVACTKTKEEEEGEWKMWIKNLCDKSIDLEVILTQHLLPPQIAAFHCTAGHGASRS
jgi:hypothetical protein